jgi:hypothetical protein
VALKRGFLTQEHNREINTMQKQLLCMNALIERMMISENLGTRSAENRTLDRKIWALQAFKGKTYPSEGSRGICGIFNGCEALARKNRGLCGV